MKQHRIANLEVWLWDFGILTFPIAVDTPPNFGEINLKTNTRLSNPSVVDPYWNNLKQYEVNQVYENKNTR